VKGPDMEYGIRDACVHAYPDPKHYLRVNIKRLMSHSIRIFACVALQASGLQLDEICYRLRWDSEAVKAYLRDCQCTVDAMTVSAFQGAYHDEGLRELPRSTTGPSHAPSALNQP